MTDFSTDSLTDSLFQRAGGHAVVHAIIERFVRRMRRDIMIGFLFEKVDEKNLIQREFEFTARFLGAEMNYTGRPIAQVHAPLRIMGGHFDRRRQILKEEILSEGIDTAVASAWLEHVDRLRPVVTGHAPGECD
jgi:hemoglobin